MVLDSVVLLEKVLALEPEDSTSKLLLLNEICTSFDDQQSDDDLYTYVSFEISQKFSNIDPTECNLKFDDLAQWGELLSFQTGEPEYITSLQIIICLIENSIVNKQLFGKQEFIKEIIKNRIREENNERLKSVFTELFYQIVSVNASQDDFSYIFKEPPYNWDLIESIGNQVTQLYLQSHLLLENTYISYHGILISESFTFTVEVWLELLNSTSNRILTLGTNLYVEIKECNLCLSNDEYILALFESFEFEIGGSYSVCLCFESYTVTLFVNSQLVQTISIIPDKTNEMKSIEIGSMISFFRLYKMRLWDKCLTAREVNSLFDSVLSEDALQLQNIIIDLSMDTFLRKCSKDNDHFVIIDIKNSFPAGHCFFFQCSNIIGLLNSTNALQYLFDSFLIETKPEELELFNSSFIQYLKHPELNKSFTKARGYSMWSYALAQKTQSGYKIGPDLLREIFELSRVCFKHDSSLSILTDETPFQILLNMSLFNASPDDIEEPFMQLSTFILTHMYKSIGSNDMTALQRSIISQVYLHFNVENIEALSNSNQKSLLTLFISLLEKNLSKDGISTYLQFAYFSATVGNASLSKILLSSLNSVFQIHRTSNNEILCIAISKNVYVKILLILLEVCIYDFESVREILSILFQLFELQPGTFEQFVNGNGYNILFSILSLHSTELEQLIVFLLQNITSTDFGMESDFNSVLLLSENMFTLTSNTMVVQLLEWYVMNDIRHEYQKVTELIISYLKLLRKTMIDDRFFVLFSSSRTSCIKALIELNITLEKPQNSDIYRDCVEEITDLLTEFVLEKMKTTDNESFALLLRGLFGMKSYGLNHLYKTSSTSYIKKYFLAFLSPILFPKLTENLAVIPELQDQRSNLIENLIYYLYLISNIWEMFVLPLEDAQTTHMTILAAKELVLNSSFSELQVESYFKRLNDIHETLLRVIYFQVSKKISTFDIVHAPFLRSFLYYQELLFIKRKKQCSLSNESVAELLCFLILVVPLIPPTDQSLAINVFRTVCILREQDLNTISKILCGNQNHDCFLLLSSSLTYDDELLLQKLSSVNCKQIFEKGLLHINRISGVKKSDYYHSHQRVFSSELFLQICSEKETAFNAFSKEIDKMHSLFKQDSTSLTQKMILVEEKRLSDYMSDENHKKTSSFNAIKSLKNSLAAEKYLNDKEVLIEWTVDRKENNNRQRKKLTPLFNLDSIIKPPDLNSTKSIPTFFHTISKRSNKSTNSFEVVSTSAAFDSESDQFTDRNRVILQLLNDHEIIKKIWNGTNIVGLKIEAGILVLGSNSLYFIPGYYYNSNEKKVVDIELTPSELKDTTVELISVASTNNNNNHSELRTNPHSVWEIAALTNIIKRPFLLRDTAMEIFLASNVTIMFSFRNHSVRDQVFDVLEVFKSKTQTKTLWASILDEVNLKSTNVGLKNGISQISLTDRFTNALSGITKTHNYIKVLDLWKSGKLSNFDYLMAVNTIAGRSFNDITQYPVFPWVISDYESETIDLEDSKVYRDLSKPMGAQSERRMLEFVERFKALESLKDESTPPFHYGTHYSSAMIVSSYLVRLQPYSGFYKLLQGEEWGPPDRLFNSVLRAWMSASSENTTDVRELIPEFFYLSDFLLNKNNYDFGVSQSGKVVSDVSLPAWANGDPKIFIEMNRKALESEYVSKHLHEWIDLIFGYKQRGEEAKTSINVFNSISYSGNVDLNGIDNENEKRAITGIIHNFGQTPLQIFQHPHPPRHIYPKLHNLSSVVSSLNGKLVITTEHSARDTSSQRSSISVLDDDSIVYNHKIIKKAHACKIVILKKLDEKTIISADDMGLIKLWRMEGDMPDHYTSLCGHRCCIKSIKIATQYNAIVSLDQDGCALMWDTSDGQISRKISGKWDLVSISRLTGNILAAKGNKFIISDINGSKYCEELTSSDISAVCFLHHVSDWSFQYHQEIDVVFIAVNDKIMIFSLELCNSNWSLVLLRTLNQSTIRNICHISISIMEGTKDATEKIEITAADKEENRYTWK